MVGLERLKLLKKMTPGLVVPRWRGGTDPSVLPVCLAPWYPAPGDLPELLVHAVGIGPDDVFVDLGSGDGRVVNGVVGLKRCRGVGIEASGDLVRVARARARVRRLEDRVTFLHELIGQRGLRGASVVYWWLLPGALGGLRRLIDSELRRSPGSGGLRVLVTVGICPEVEAVAEFRTVARLECPVASGQSGLVDLRCARVGR